MINMEKELLNEILRIRLLSNYDMKSTLTENKEIILEKTAKVIGDLGKKERALLAASETELKTALSQGKKLTITAKDGVTLLRTTDEIIGALKAGNLAPAEAGRVYRNAFKNTTDPKLLKGIADLTVDGTGFISKYGNLNKSDFISRVTRDLKIGPQQAEALFKSNTKRLSKLTKNASKNARKSGNININNINNNSNNFIHSVEYTKELNKYADDWMRTTGKDADELARKYKFKNLEDWGRNDMNGMIRVMESEARTGRGFFGRTFAKGRRFATVWSIVKWGSLAVGAYWLYKQLFSGSNECADEPGTHMVEGVGCVPDGGDGGGGEGGGEGEGEGGKGGGDTEDKGPNGENLKDSEGNKYVVCEPPYYKGCVGKKGDDNIKKAQDCLGVTPNGFFNQETEDALKNKINKKSFTSSDMSAICAKSYGGGSFQI